MLRSSINLLKQHFGLLPLVGSVSFVSVLAATAGVYTVVRKNDIQLNRWKKTQRFEEVDWNNVREKLLPRKEEVRMHKDDPALRQLLSDIYRDGRYR